MTSYQALYDKGGIFVGVLRDDAALVFKDDTATHPDWVAFLDWNNSNGNQIVVRDDPSKVIEEASTPDIFRTSIVNDPTISSGIKTVLNLYFSTFDQYCENTPYLKAFWAGLLLVYPISDDIQQIIINYAAQSYMPIIPD